MNRDIRLSQWVVALLLALPAVLAALPALAQQIDFPPELADLCSYNADYEIQLPPTGTGIITLLVYNISLIINNLAFALYHSLISQQSFQDVIRAMLTLYVMVYGILFTFGMTHITLMEFLLRVIKFAVVAILISPQSWNFFYNFVGMMFYDGVNWLISIMASIAVGGAPGINPDFPFEPLDNAIAVLTSARLMVTMIATFFTGPYGIILGLMILAGLGTFAAAVFQAMWVYLMSLVVRAFLFALAPIFMAFMLFQRTFHLFQGWVNALVSASLQPIFLFAFFAFFVQLIYAAVAKLLFTPVCYTSAGEVWRGSPFDVETWRFMVPVQVSPGSWQWQTYKGAWSFTGADMQGAPVFPIPLVDILVFLLLVQLAWRFHGIAVNIAKDIAGASLSLNLSGAMSDWLSPARGRIEGVQSAARDAIGRAREGGAAMFTPDKVKIAKDIQDAIDRMVNQRRGVGN